MIVIPEHSPMNMVVSIYKTDGIEGLYLYLDKSKGLDSIPDSLQTLMGEPVHVFDMLLTPERHLAAVDSILVLNKIGEFGYYLQMPPTSQNDDYAITLPDTFSTF